MSVAVVVLLALAVGFSAYGEQPGLELGDTAASGAARESAEGQSVQPGTTIGRETSVDRLLRWTLGERFQTTRELDLRREEPLWWTLTLPKVALVLIEGTEFVILHEKQFNTLFRQDQWLNIEARIEGSDGAELKYVQGWIQFPRPVDAEAAPYAHVASGTDAEAVIAFLRSGNTARRPP